MFRTLPTILIASAAVYASDVDPMEHACSQLVAALEQEVSALASIQQASDVPAGLEKFRNSIQALEKLFSVDEKLLWQYIDNTAGAKQPVVDVLEQLALQFKRIKQAAYFGDAGLRAALAPQTEPGSAPGAGKKAKREKLQTIDHDD